MPSPFIQLPLPIPAVAPPRQPVRNNVFFALLPPPDAALAAAKTATAAIARWPAPARCRPLRLLHVSLVGIDDDAPDPRLALVVARQVADRIRAAPFVLRFERALSFKVGTRWALVLAIAAAQAPEELRQLRAAMATSLGQRPARADAFVPHLTLLYTPVAVPEHRVPPVEWKVERFALVHSFVGQSRYEILESWPLVDSCPRPAPPATPPSAAEQLTLGLTGL